MLQNNTLQLSSNPHLDNTKKIIGQKFAERIRQTSQLSLFKDLDKNGDGYVTLLELKVYFLNMGLKLSDDELYSFISGVDLDRNNKIDIKEFLSYVLAGFNVSSDDRYIEKSISSQSKFHEIDDSNTREITHGKKIDVLLIKMLDAILIFMNNNKLTFLKLYDKIDSDHNNFLTKSELNDFLKKIGLEFNGFSDINALLNHLDENGDNRISIKEFINKIKEHSSNRNNYSLYDDEYSEVSMQSLNSKIVEYICQYLCSSNSSVSDFFNFIDKNNDGILSREELNLLFVKTLKLTLNQDEQSTFFNFLDNNRDNRITIPEFNGIIRPGVEIAMKNQKFMNSSNMMSSAKLSKIDSPYSADFINNLQNKVYEYINRNQTNLKSSFQLKPSENTGFVSQEHFKQVLLEVKFDQINEFTLKEITAIIERLCERNSNGFINYENFLELARNRPKKMTNFSIPNVGSSRDMLKSQKMAKEVFEKIAKVVKARNIQLQQAFKTFDMDQDGTIDVEEFKKAFDAMKLNYSAEDVEEIVRVVGVNGKVNYQKFIEALKLK